MGAVPAEHLGLARRFRQDVMRTDDRLLTALPRITAPLQRRLARKPGLRQDAAIDFARAWRMATGPYRLAHDADVRAKDSITITELRLAATGWRHPHWETWEDGVGIVHVQLTTQGGFKVETTPLVVVSLHALARWFERTGQREHKLLVNDLTPLLAGRDAERVVVRAGIWLGGLIVAYDKLHRPFRLRAVRTFLAHEQIEDRKALEVAA